MDVQMVIRTVSGDIVTSVWETVDVTAEEIYSATSQILTDPNESMGQETDDGVVIVRVAAIDSVRVRTRP